MNPIEFSDGVDVYDVGRVWAIFTGCEGEDPALDSIHLSRESAQSVIDEALQLDGNEYTSYLFDPCIVVGVIRDGKLHVVNDDDPDHEQLETRITEWQATHAK